MSLLKGGTKKYRFKAMYCAVCSVHNTINFTTKIVVDFYGQNIDTFDITEREVVVDKNRPQVDEIDVGEVFEVAKCSRWIQGMQKLIKKKKKHFRWPDKKVPDPDPLNIMTDPYPSCQTFPAPLNLDVDC